MCLDLSGCVRKKCGIKSILQHLEFRTCSYIFHFVIFSVFFEFSTPTQNVQFHIHRGYIEIGLSEVIKFWAGKLIKRK